MGDVFKEQLVKRAANTKSRSIKALIIGVTFVLVLAVTIFLGQFGTILGMLILFGAYWLLSTQNLEYEYILTNSELDIDVIYNRVRRKRGFSVDIKKIDLMAHALDKEQLPNFKAAEITKDYSAGAVNENTYYFIVNLGGKKTKVIFDPDENMLGAMGSLMSPRKLIKKK